MKTEKFHNSYNKIINKFVAEMHSSQADAILIQNPEIAHDPLFENIIGDFSNFIIDTLDKLELDTETRKYALVVAAMRAAQIEYFKTQDNQKFEICKMLEAKIDKITANIIQGESPPITVVPAGDNN